MNREWPYCLAASCGVDNNQGCRWQDGVVTAADGFKDAYRLFSETGWNGLAVSDADLRRRAELPEHVSAFFLRSTFCHFKARPISGRAVS